MLIRGVYKTDKLYPLGENGITFTLFNDLVQNKKVTNFLSDIDWVRKNRKLELQKENVKFVFLFPSFGRGKKGLGEPDAIIVTQRYNVFFELEMCRIDELKHFFDQFERFIFIGERLYESDQMRVSKKYGMIFSSEKQTKGTKKQRKLFKEILGKKEPLYVLITNDTKENKEKIFAIVEKKWPTMYNNFGFMNYGRIKKIKGLPNTARIINFNLEK